jgi:hypothetical protein
LTITDFRCIIPRLYKRCVEVTPERSACIGVCSDPQAQAVPGVVNLTKLRGQAKGKQQNVISVIDGWPVRWYN